MTTFLPKPTILRVLLPLLLLQMGFLLPSRLSAQCPVNASFVASNVYICQGQSINFTNTTTGGANAYAWLDNGTFFSSATNPVRSFALPGNFVISLIAGNGTCTDTFNTVVVVGAAVGSSVTGTNPTCFNGTNGSANLTPSGGTLNRSIDNNRAISDYTAANSVTAAGYTNGITVEAWVKPRSTWTSGDGLFVAFNNQVGTFNRFFIGYNSAFQQFVYYDDNLGNQFQNGTAARGVWHHVAVTINNSNVMNMYVNGVLRKTVTTNANWIPVAGELFSMGQEWDNASGLVTSQHFDGNLDEVRVWNTVLTPSVLSSNFSGCMSVTPTHPNWPNLVAYYSMNEGSGTFVFDRSGRGNHGSRINGSAYGTPAQTNWGCFSAGTGYGYNWSNGATVEDPTSLPAAAYTVTVIDGAGCTHVNSVTLTNPAQVVVSTTPSTSTAICLGNSVPLSASGANTYAWSPALGLSATTGANVTASPGITTTYTVQGTNAVGCTGSTTIQVVVNPLPTATITGNNILCLGDTTTLTAGGGTGFSWSNGPGTATNTVSPGGNITYIVTVTDINSCQDTAQINVVVNPLPVVTISGIDTICMGDSTTLTASGGSSFSWSSGDNSPSTTVAPAGTNTYVVTVTDLNTCENTGSVTVQVNALPVLSFAGLDTICLGDTTSITVSGGTSYAWLHGPTTAAVDLSPSATTTYPVTAIDSNGCFGTDSVEVVVNSLPIAIITGNDTICEGDTATLNGTGGTGFAWSTGASTGSINVAPASTSSYGLTVTDGNGCEGSTSHQVFVNPSPVVGIAGLDTICAGDSLNLIATGGGSYAWSTGANTTGITVTPAATTTYMVTVTDGNGCTGDASHTVNVAALPATPVITQNGNTLSTGTGYASYQWYLNGSPVAGATSDTYVGTQSGTVSVVVTNAAGCEASSTELTFVFVSIASSQLEGLQMTLYPNPSDGRFQIKLHSDRSRDLSLRIFDLAGKLVWEMKGSLEYGDTQQAVDIKGVASGTYLVELQSEGGRMSQRIVVQ